MAKVTPEAVVSGLVARGYEPHQAAGIAGNLALESNFDTSIREINPQTESARKQGGGFGLAQWTSPERKQGLFNMAQMRGVPVDDLDLQLDYLDHELKTTHKKALTALQSAKNPRQAAFAISRYYEVPAPKYAHNSKRMSAAESFFNMINPIGTAYADETPYQGDNMDSLGGEYQAFLKSQPQKTDDLDSLGDEYKTFLQGSEKTAGQKVGEVITDIGGGVLKGASNIGNTLISAADKYNDLVGNKYSLTNQIAGEDDQKNLTSVITGQKPKTADEKRREAATEGLKSMGVDTDSGTYKAAELGTEIAGTAGAGTALAAGAKAIPAISKLAPAIESWGMQGGNLAQKAAGGAITGAASSALVDPETALAGGVVGAALPVGIRGAEKLGIGIVQGYRSLTRPAQEKIADKIVAATGKGKDEIIDLLTNQARAAELPDLLRTVPQILQDPSISQLARTVKTNSSMALGEAEAAQQNVFKQALEGIAPSGVTVQDAADKAGSAISQAVQEDYKWATKIIGEKFNALRNNPEKNIDLPIDKLRATVNQYIGSGTVGKGSGAKAALNEAEKISKPPKPDKPSFSQLFGAVKRTEPEKISKVSFKELQNLRSSIGDLAQQAELVGKNTENAALKQMVSDIDNHLDKLANSPDGMTIDTLQAYKEARGLHKAKMERFKTGAQSGLFKPKSNGEMAVEGGEIPGKFYSSKASQSRDVQSFKRLVNNNDALIKELKEFALTKAGQTATANGNLAQGYVKWAKSHSGANKKLFNSTEKAKIDAIAREISLASKAENLGRVTGSDTAQKLKAITDLGLVDNKFINLLANKVPMGSGVLNAIKESSGRERSNLIAELLADPEKLKAALEIKRAAKPNKFAGISKIHPLAIPAASRLLTQQ